jgi:proline iminopeptidase
MAMMPIRDAHIYVEILGRGYPLVFMHGGLGQDHTSLLSFKPLADQYTLVFYDHRCNGRSIGPDISTMTMENLTADAEALRQALGFNKWAVLGHSFGGQIALEYALRFPQSLSHVILMNSGGDNWWVQHNAAELIRKRGYRPAVEQAAHRFFNGQVEPGNYLSAFFKFFRAYYYHFNPLEMVREVIIGPRMQLRPEATIFGYRHVVNDWTVMDRLSEIQAPALVLAGRHDFLFPPEHQAILADRLPNSKLVLVERAGHNPHMERSAEVIRTVREFLAA